MSYHGVCKSLRCAVEDCVFSEISLVASWWIVFQQILNWISGFWLLLAPAGGWLAGKDFPPPEAGTVRI